jgi:uncharacterized protein YgbK (DUF1537 family)
LELPALRADFGAAIDTIVHWAQSLWNDDEAAIPLVYSVDSDADILSDVAAPPMVGTSVEPASELIERALAEIGVRFAAKGVRRLVVAGGESSGRVMQHLGVSALRIGPEISPGVAWSFGVTSAGHPMVVALKSGNFGDIDMFTSAWKVLDARSGSTQIGIQ